MSSTPTTPGDTAIPPITPGARQAFAIATGVATLFVFVQFFTSSEFIKAHGSAAEAWVAVHGATALGVVVPALVAAVVALVALRRRARALTVVSTLLVVAAVCQDVTGNLISVGNQDGWIPFHVFFSSIVLTLAVWASIRSAVLRRG